MAEIGIIFHTNEILDSCSCCKELAEGECVKIVLDGTNPLWPTHIVGLVYCVEKTKTGRTYKFKIDDDDLNGGPMPNSCNMDISCYSDLDKFKDELLAGESEYFQAIVDAVIAQLP